VSEAIARRKPSVGIRLTLLIVATLLTLGAVEVVLRIIGPPTPTKGLYYRDAAGNVVDPNADDFRQKMAEANVIRGFQPPVSPRPRNGFKAGARFYICYPDAEGDWFDDRGCVEVRFSGPPVPIRERDEIGVQKPEGQYRILCIGDSFTFGWGIPVEDVWVRRVEQELRRSAGDHVRTVNCGAQGTTVVDEYRAGLEHRFHKLKPDAVVVTLCLNDLLVTNGGLCHLAPPPNTGLAILDFAQRTAWNPLALDPDVDWTQLLLDVPADDPLYVNNKEIDYDMLWASGNPQQHLEAMQAWCAEREIPFGVVIWPFLQQLDDGEHYPFQGIHDRVRAFCEEKVIPFHDVLPSLRGRPAAELWVHPSDLHANPLAQQLATPGIAAFVRDLTGLR